ncbi:MAG: DNA polymerase I [Candidatus Saccharibacteria bacterium]|nr:DNA polymerase I [Candidatus Saccharibacteria bacterium]
MAEQRKKLAIIDGKSVFYRGFYAMSNLATKDGTPSGGVYGFAVMALEVIKRLQPDYVCVAWDKPKTNIRKRLAIYPAYKAGRKAPPPEFYAQIPILHELLDAFGWPLYELDDYEADDIMGALAVQATDKNIDTMLITSDMDMLQLVNDHVKVYALKTGLSNIELYSPKSFTAKYGIEVEQFLDLKSLKGDSSDNIPGVPGIGEKTALELLKQYKTLDEIYENTALLKDSVAKKLVAGKDSAYMSRELANIWIDAPIKLDLKEVDGTKSKPEVILDIFKKLEFRTLVRQLPDVMQVQEQHAERNVYEHGTTGKNIVIDSNEKLEKLKLAEIKSLVIHSRSAGKHGRDPRVLILSPDPKTIYTLDLTKLNPKSLSSQLSSIESVIGYDVKSTLKVFIELGIPLPKVEHDVQVAAFLLNSLRRERSLTELAESDLGYDGSPFEDIDDEEYKHRAPELIGVIRSLEAMQSEAMSELTGLIKVAQDIDMPVIPVIARMEYEGIELNTAYLKEMSDRVGDMVSDFEQQIYGYADQEFNISSPAQLADILFDKLKLPTLGIKKGKTSYSTAASELDKLRDQHPIIDVISQFREVTKLKNTYIDTLPEQVDENSRLHTTFNMTVAQTGRLSSSDPNLQNIPVKTDLGREIRTAFVAAPERVFIGADYSQFELRLAAYLSGDTDLMDQFNRDVDVHTATAALVYDRAPEDVTKNMRREAKAVNFGIMYGQGPHGLVQTTGMTYAAAKSFIDKYFEVRPKLLKYIEAVREQAKTKGYVETLYGRRRPTPDALSANFAVREAAYRAAVNMPFQGTAADIMKMAMISVQQMLDKLIEEKEYSSENQPKILLQIHDSILVECIESQAESVAKMIKETMEGVVKLPIKLTADTAIGKNWGEL